MTYSLHRYTGALSKCLLALIGVILLAGQLTWQPTAAADMGSATTPSSAAATTTAAASAITASTIITATSTTAVATVRSITTLRRQPVRDQENGPDAHCHRNVCLLPDKRHDLKPVFFIPLPSFRLAILAMEHPRPAYSFSSSLAAGAVRPASLRGPPSI